MKDVTAAEAARESAGKPVGQGGASPAVRWAVRVVSAFAGVAGLAWGYDFGHRVDGVFMGVVAGANLAVLAALLAGAGADWLAARVARRRREG